MQELINVSAVPAKLSVNFDELREHLAQQLKKYEIVVTADTLADAKKLATEINQTAGLIDKSRKEEVAKVSGPIKAFDGQMKELVDLCKGGRQKILDQVKRFEDEVRETARSLLTASLVALWTKHEVQAEFRRAEFDDLILLTSVTAKGNLARAAADKLESRVRDDRAFQDRTRMRLIELENQSYKAGLAAPLTRDHVRPFLFDPDERYAVELQRILAAEVQRQEEAERRLRDRIEREGRENEERARVAEAARLKREAEQKEQEDRLVEELQATAGAAQAEPQEIPDDEAPFEPEQSPAPSQYKAASGRTDWVATATFEISAPIGVGRNEIAAELHRVMAKAGITTLRSVSVVPDTAHSTD